jgi:hypothetical protein
MYANEDGVASKLQKTTFTCGKCGSTITVNDDQSLALASGERVTHSCEGETDYFPAFEMVDSIDLINIFYDQLALREFASGLALGKPLRGFLA